MCGAAHGEKLTQPLYDTQENGLEYRQDSLDLLKVIEARRWFDDAMKGVNCWKHTYKGPKNHHPRARISPKTSAV
jgi:hypothetical protein